VLDGGCIVESGSHAELLARDGYYAKLLRMQDGTGLEIANAPPAA
jgi:ABC-type multidrug transport system fused ATPase/permease subunit